MNGKKPLIAALAVSCVLALPAYGEDPPSQQEFSRVLPRDLQRQELADLREVVAQLLQRIERLERRLAQTEPRIRLEAAENFDTDRPQNEQPRRPTTYFSGVHEGMMIDAIEHGRRWRRRR